MRIGLTTEAVITEVPEKNQPHRHAASGMGDMY
jgi:hypothetical protein